MSDAPEQISPKESLKQIIDDILATIDQDREREIITRRFGLFDRKETLEQIGELLGITRERVRQLEKAILIRLKLAAEEGRIDSLQRCEKQLISSLTELGRLARIQDLTEKLMQQDSDLYDRARVAFVAELSPNLSVLNENDNYHQVVGIAEYGDDKKIKSAVDEIVKAIKKAGQPVTVDELHEQLSYDHPSHIHALATASKHLAHLNGQWGLAKWPTVNQRISVTRST